MAFVERSILTDLYSFASHLYETGHINTLQWKIYTSLLKEHLKDAVPHFGDVNIIFLNLRTEPDECFKRKVGRGRVEESTVPLLYLEMLHQKNDFWLREKVGAVPRIIIDGHQSKENILDAVLEQVGSFHLKTQDLSGVELLNLEVQQHL